MKIIKYISFSVLCLASLTACDDNDTFSSDPTHKLCFQRDSISLDTVFANTHSSYKMIQVYNNTEDGLKISSIRLQKGTGKSGFMVNVNGSYIAQEQNNQITDMELRRGDSLRIFVEYKPLEMPDNQDIRKAEDNVVFTYESGTTQTLNLYAWTWNTNCLTKYHVKSDTTFTAGRPLIIYDTLFVDRGTTLTIDKGTTIYFHQNAGIDVRGALNITGDKENEVTLRCDRLDSLLQLKYDNVPGKWKGIQLHPGAKADINYMNLHGSDYGIICDTATVAMKHSTIHNIKGPAVLSTLSTVDISNTQLSNAMEYCLYMTGGKVTVTSSTLASFYAYSASSSQGSGRLNALYFTDIDASGKLTPLTFCMTNSLVTGYENDELWYTPFKADSLAKGIKIDNCLLRTVKPTGADSVMITNSYFENLEDTINGSKNFVTFDTNNFYYDFTPQKSSKAVGMAKPDPLTTDDRKGNKRKEEPDVGCFETFYGEEK